MMTTACPQRQNPGTVPQLCGTNGIQIIPACPSNLVLRITMPLENHRGRNRLACGN